MLKLPKNVLAHPKVSELEALFSVKTRPLYSQGKLTVPTWDFGQSFCKALKLANSTKNLVQGLETIEKHLDKEQKGLNALKRLPGQIQNQRLSRLLILSNDGSERFYHSAESILLRHADRTLCCIVEASAEQLGEAFSGPSNLAKAVLIDERKALETFLISLVENL